MKLSCIDRVWQIHEEGAVGRENARRSATDGTSVRDIVEDLLPGESSCDMETWECDMGVLLDDLSNSD